MELEIIRSKIYEIRGQRVMLDRDLAQMYGVETKALKRSVKSNIKRFPPDFMFELTKEEFEGLRCKICTSNKQGGIRYLPFAFTEQGVAMLSGLLNSDVAINVNISIMRAFVTMRNYVSSVSTITSDLAEFKERLLQIEQSCKDNADAVNDLSEDIQNELDDIYLAMSQLAAKQKEIDSKSPRPRIGFKK